MTKETALDLAYKILGTFAESKERDAEELDELETMANIAEISFWDEIDNLYRYFDEEMARLGYDR